MWVYEKRVALDLLTKERSTQFNFINAAFTISGFDDQERNLTFVKTAF